MTVSTFVQLRIIKKKENEDIIYIYRGNLEFFILLNLDHKPVVKKIFVSNECEYRKLQFAKCSKSAFNCKCYLHTPQIIKREN